MKIGLWNIAHPETGSAEKSKEQRFLGVVDYLSNADCDLFVITEANAAITLPGYYSEFSAPSPFKSKKRFYGHPNSYHQVAIYSKHRLERVPVEEPVNGLLCRVTGTDLLRMVYGNVITIKDQWSETSDKKYKDRLNEQILAIRSLSQSRTLVGGDFNLRSNWPQKKFAHDRIQNELENQGWVWPTKTRGDTVQHVLASEDLSVKLEFDFLVKNDERTELGLSDHPFIKILLSAAPPGQAFVGN